MFFQSLHIFYLYLLHTFVKLIRNYKFIINLIKKVN